MTTRPLRSIQPLKGIRVLSLGLNLPAPAALMRCREMGAVCIKLEPPPRAEADRVLPADPMAHYNRAAYNQLHQEIRVTVADLKTEPGQKILHRELAKADVLLSSFRPSALQRLGLSWQALQTRYPSLSQVAIVGAPGKQAEAPGHDLTYLAQSGLLPTQELPATLYADMGGALMASEAVLQAVLLQKSGQPSYIEVALSTAADYLALPNRWGLTRPGGLLGGCHAGYRIYACRDGRVAVAALEPHFAQRLCELAGVRFTAMDTMFLAATQAALTAYLGSLGCTDLDALATANDIPLVTLPDQAR